MKSSRGKLIDMHVHVGLLGDEYPQWGRLSEFFQQQLAFKIFLLYGRVKPNELSDRVLRAAALQTIDESAVDHVVCLALDPVYDGDGQRREDKSHMWVDNEYVLDLRNELGEKILLGASVHPYDPAFAGRVEEYVGKGAVLLKWLPSAQQIDLADPRVGTAMKYLATAGSGGGPLPLLLHIGAEYAIPTSDPRAKSYDFLSWTWWDRFWNAFRRRERRWYRPDVEAIKKNLDDALSAGAVIIFGHCGLPYFAGTAFRRFLEHSDLEVIRSYLEKYRGGRPGGRALADVSACATPFRKPFFSRIAQLPRDSLVYGSDFPTPVFELSRDLEEAWRDMKAVFRGELDRIVIPHDNLLDVNYRELSIAFPEHPLFTKFETLLPGGPAGSSRP
jgi:predicted TIM-barrel fold metal-dependent hydrolase